MLRLIYFLIFPFILVYPNGLLANTYLNHIYIYLAFIFFLIFERGNKSKFTKTNSFFLFLFVFVLIANIWSIQQKNEIPTFNYFASTLRYLSYFLLSHIIVNSTKNEKQFKFWIYSFSFGFILSLILIFLNAYRVLWVETIFQMSTFEEKQTLEVYFRAYGAYLSPISASIFILNYLLLLLSLLSNRILGTTGEKIGIWFLTIISIIAIFFTASRTSLIGLVATLIIILFFSKFKFKFRLIFISIACGIIVYQTGILNQFIENVFIRSENETAIGNNILIGSGRIETAINSIRLYFGQRTFYFGVGPTEYSIGDKVFSMAHNGFLSLLFCYGIAGVYLFIRLVWKLRQSIKIKIVNIAQLNYSRFLKFYFYLFVIINSITFITSDGPVTHFWLIYFLIFIFFIENSISLIIKKTN